jgi:hypothetical protein
MEMTSQFEMMNKKQQRSFIFGLSLFLSLILVFAPFLRAEGNESERLERYENVDSYPSEARFWKFEEGDSFSQYFTSNQSSKFHRYKYLFRSSTISGNRSTPFQTRTQPFALNSVKSYRVHPVRLGILGSVTAGTGIALNDYYNRIWWEEEPQEFHFNDDFSYLRLTDKFGHFYVALLITELYTPLFRWSGFSPGNARLGGVGASLLHQIVFVEYQDGFSHWGFSTSDAISDVLGAFYPLLQDQVPVMEHINWKWSYHPSLHSWGDYLDMKTLLDDLYDNAFHMDYNGMTFWLTGDIHPILPQSLKSYWPDFLNIAAGYSTEGMDIMKSGTGSSEIFLALDYDLKDLPGDGKIWNGIKSVLNILHPPAPALRITPDATFYLLYF